MEVAAELGALSRSGRPLTRPQLRQVFALYAQLSEAGGFYETISNVMGVLARRPYTMWPFRTLVRVRQNPRRIIGPHANAVFRDMATSAEQVGLLGLASVLEEAFRDDLRNAISHSDYTFAPEGIRLRRRNGGYPDVVSYEHFADAVSKGLGFFELVRQHWAEIVFAYHPPREVVGRFSENPPMRYEVGYDPTTRSFSLSTSSVGFGTTPEYLRQEEINTALDRHVFAMFVAQEDAESGRIAAHLAASGFGCRVAVFPGSAELEALAADVDAKGLWDLRWKQPASGKLLASPFGFFRVDIGADFVAQVLPAVEDLTIVDPVTSGGPRRPRKAKNWAVMIRDAQQAKRPRSSARRH